LATVIFLGLTAVPSRAHEGHAHGDEPKAPTVATMSTPRAEASSATFELVAVAKGGTVQIYLDSYATNEPIKGATITADGADGSHTASALEEGIYSFEAPWAATPGKHDVMLTVAAGEAVDVFPLTVMVPGPGTVPAAPAASGMTLSGWLPSEATMPVLSAAGVGFLAGIGIMLLGRRRRAMGIALLVTAGGLLFAPGAMAHEGHAHGDEKPAAAASVRDVAQRLPDGTVYVPKPTQRILAIRTMMPKAASHARTVELPGRIIPDPNASGYVQAAIGGRLSPPPLGFPRLGSAVKQGDVLAYVTPPVPAKDASDMRQSLGELDQQISIVEQRVARFDPLAKTGALAKSDLDEAKLELKGLKERRVTLEKARVEPEALVAPISGIVAEARAAAGQMADPNAIVFNIVDPSRLWVEALSFEPISEEGEATAKLPDGRSVKLAHRGAGFAQQNQSVPVHFAIDAGTENLRIGQFVTVLAATDGSAEGLALPRTSIVRAANGQDLVFEHTTAEQFRSREVRVEPLDADRVLVAAGLEDGKRVVTQGAELLNQVR
jgi:RND family efflux transporter MFP subunit